MRIKTRHILLTGPPGIGKTTAIVQLARQLSGLEVAGFYTQEIRENGQRVGFSVAAFSGPMRTFAHVTFRNVNRVGRYGVDVAAFEKIALPEFARPCDVMLIDEIGKMECFSSHFVAAVRGLLDDRTPMVVTVAVKGSGFIAEVKARPDVELWQITRANRDEMPERLAAVLAVGPGREPL